MGYIKCIKCEEIVNAILNEVILLDKDAEEYKLVKATFEIAINAINKVPKTEVVKKDAFDQIKWERDTAIATLKEHGIGFAERPMLWQKRLGYITPGGDPVWECPVCGYTHVYGIEHQYNYARVCRGCGAELKYPHEKEMELSEVE